MSDGDACSSIKQLTSELASQRLLLLHPDEARVKGDRHSGCNQDNAYVYVGRAFAFSGAASDMLSFYKKAALGDGWEAVTGDLPSDSSTSNTREVCFSKAVKGGTAFAYVAVSADSENGSTGEYAITLSSGGGEWPSDGGVLC
ncbi:hypothetical protein [Microbispora sp. ATCC PTA-5024]|uniref:hypothetical protein n=1 Tax=Microbispora sp. ATCC PTA-5024 TaxID=316330 RepID=UPI0012EE5A51|nr:hypothetical protein [Microbispora sp. ATCC PTA-5024]